MRATTPCFKPMTLTVRSLLLDVWGRKENPDQKFFWGVRAIIRDRLSVVQTDGESGKRHFASRCPRVALTLPETSGIPRVSGPYWQWDSFLPCVLLRRLLSTVFAGVRTSYPVRVAGPVPNKRCDSRRRSAHNRSRCDVRASRRPESSLPGRDYSGSGMPCALPAYLDLVCGRGQTCGLRRRESPASGKGGQRFAGRGEPETQNTNAGNCLRSFHWEIAWSLLSAEELRPQSDRACKPRYPVYRSVLS